MKIALLGNGTMGKTIHALALNTNVEVVLAVGSHRPDGWLTELAKADVAIEFSSPEAAVNNIRECFKLKVPVVVGTTGWYAKLPNIMEECKSLDASMFYASNYSIGVNLFFELNRQFSAMISSFPQYTASMEETHHVRKKDAPSGTAISLANDLIASHSSYTHWSNEPAKQVDGLFIKSIRKDDVPGTHSILFQSETDSIELTHTAFNREGFALGALEAARFIIGKKGIFTMSDLLKFPTVHGH